MKEKLFNKKQIEALSEAEKYFNTVVNAQYKSSSPVTLNNKVADLYEAVTGEKLRREWGCSRCTFNLFKKAADLYYKSVRALEQKEVKKIEKTLEEEYKQEFENENPNEEEIVEETTEKTEDKTPNEEDDCPKALEQDITEEQPKKRGRAKKV